MQPKKYVIKKLIWILTAVLIITVGLQGHALASISSNFPAFTADLVYAQAGNFTTATSNNGGISENSLANGNGLELDKDGNLYVMDSANNRVLFFPKNTTTATRVYGQKNDFKTANANKGGISEDTLKEPYTGIALDSLGNLYLSDTTNNRVLYYPKDSTTATVVYGQNSFTSSSANKGGPASDSSLNNPYGLVIDANDNLYIADTLNNRVLFFPKSTTTATRVYGQRGAFDTVTANKWGSGGNPTAETMFNPTGLAIDSAGNLYVADNLNHRVLYFPKDTTVATRVYGQTNSFTTKDWNKGGNPSADTLYGPSDLTLDSSDNLYIGDTYNNRVLAYPANSNTATAVYGQAGSFASQTFNANVTAGTLSYPSGAAVDSSGNLFINDALGYRVLVYNSPKTAAVITFDTAPTPTYGDVSFTASATSTNSEDSTLTYSWVSGPCTQVGTTTTFTISGAGDCVVKASGVETTNFSAATKNLTVTIAKAQAVITFTSSNRVPLKDGGFTVTATTNNTDSSTITFSLFSAGPCVVDGGGNYTFTVVGTCIVQADSIATDNFTSATKRQTVTISDIIPYYFPIVSAGPITQSWFVTPGYEDLALSSPGVDYD